MTSSVIFTTNCQRDMPHATSLTRFIQEMKPGFFNMVYTYVEVLQTILSFSSGINANALHTTSQDVFLTGPPRRKETLSLKSSV